MAIPKFLQCKSVFSSTRARHHLVSYGFHYEWNSRMPLPIPDMMTAGNIYKQVGLRLCLR